MDIERTAKEAMDESLILIAAFAAGRSLCTSLATGIDLSRISRSGQHWPDRMHTTVGQCISFELIR